jgi:ribosome maturation factor RimP
MLEPVVNALGYELVLLEFSPRPGAAGLRLFIDAPQGIAIHDCERVSREVAATLDVEDPIRERYRLEVSSPGMDRPLVKPEHYRRFLGERVKLQTLVPIGTRRKFQGVLEAADAEGVTLQVGDGPVTLRYTDIERARLWPDFGAEPAAQPRGKKKAGPLGGRGRGPLPGAATTDQIES